MVWAVHARLVTAWPRGLATAVRRGVLHDYNRAAERGWWLCVLSGAATLAYAVGCAAAASPATGAWLALACVLAAGCAWFQHLTRPKSGIGVDGGEFLVMLTLLALGPELAPLVAASNATAGALLTGRRWSARIFSPACAALAAASAGAVHTALGEASGRMGLHSPAAAGLLAAAAGAVYFTTATLLVSAVPRLKRGLPVIDWQPVWAHRWLGLTFAGCALAAFLVWRTLQQPAAQSGLPAMLGAALLLGSLLSLAMRAVVSERRKVRAADERAQAMALLAETDPLTGLGNRRSFDQALDAGPAALLLLDVDGFKQVNDQHGHPAGDRLLQLIALRLRHEVRPTDRLARLGGDEFAVLVNAGPAPADLAALAQRLVAAMRQPFVLDGAVVQAGISVGMAQAGPGTAGLLARADRALLAAKGQGKNRWCEMVSTTQPAGRHSGR